MNEQTRYSFHHLWVFVCFPTKLSNFGKRNLFWKVSFPFKFSVYSPSEMSYRLQIPSFNSFQLYHPHSYHIWSRPRFSVCWWSDGYPGYLDLLEEWYNRVEHSIYLCSTCKALYQTMYLYTFVATTKDVKQIKIRDPTPKSHTTYVQGLSSYFC